MNVLAGVTFVVDNDDYLTIDVVAIYNFDVADFNTGFSIVEVYIWWSIALEL